MLYSHTSQNTQRKSICNILEPMNRNIPVQLPTTYRINQIDGCNGVLLTTKPKRKKPRVQGTEYAPPTKRSIEAPSSSIVNISSATFSLVRAQVSLVTASLFIAAHTVSSRNKSIAFFRLFAQSPKDAGIKRLIMERVFLHQPPICLPTAACHSDRDATIHQNNYYRLKGTRRLFALNLKD